MGFWILQAALMHVHTETSDLCLMWLVLTKNQNVQDSDLSVFLTASTCGFQDPIATKVKIHFLVPHELPLGILHPSFRQKN